MRSIAQGQNASAARVAVAYTDQYLDWMLGAGDGSHPTNPVRAKLATEMLVRELGASVRVVDPGLADERDVRAAIESIHDSEYVAEVIDSGRSGEWAGEQVALGRTAQTMFAGTQLLVDEIVAGRVLVGFNPQGAKHHAQFANSSGFCVFNDMVWAALEFARAGLRPIYIDWDIHAGDGVQHLLADTSIPTLSVHNHSAFPYDPETVNREMAEAGIRHTAHDTQRSIYNWGVNPTDGDDALAWAIELMGRVVDDYRPDVILLAAGADGHGGANRLGVTNTYSYAGFDHAARAVARWASEHCDGRVLIGGAGGYQPLDHTPKIWANVVSVIAAGRT